MPKIIDIVINHDFKFTRLPQYNIKSHINTKILEIVTSLGIKVYWSYAELASVTGSLDPFVSMCAGFYDSVNDFIAMNENASQNHNLVLLHEIGHWSGHSSRLARSAIILKDGFNKPISHNTSPNYFALYHNEEGIAQYCMYYLALALNIDINEAHVFLKTYNNSYGLIDDAYCAREGLKAAEYILKLAGIQELVAA